MPLNLLIADDSTNIRAFIKKTMEAVGLEINHVYEASNGQEALDLIKVFDIDLLLTDINMPVLNGLELIKSIQKNPELKPMKIVVVSTEGSRDVVVEALKSGASGYLKKPFSPEEAMELMDELRV